MNKALTITYLGLILLLHKTSVAQNYSNDIIKIYTASSYHLKKDKVTKRSFIEIDRRDSTIKYYRRENSKRRILKWDEQYEKFLDTALIDSLRVIAVSNLTDEPICQFHNEKRYFIVELIQVEALDPRETPIAINSFIINKPYRCKNRNVEAKITEFLSLYRVALSR